ncbi:MAG TPA: hypothetical protein DCL54_14920 [Alphaproteobacteria bacterium]|nr:hypothetical protein [Alphaproteobacteria bacterium]
MLRRLANRRQVLGAGLSLALCARAGGAEPLASVTAIRDGHLLLVPVWVGPMPAALFVLDTGAAVTVIDTAWAQRAKLALGPGLTLGAPGREGGLAARALAETTLTVGGATRSLKAAAADLAGLRRALSSEVQGVLGHDFLSAYNLTADFAEGRVVLAPGGAVRPTGSHDMRVAGQPFVQARVIHRGRALSGTFGVDTGADTAVHLLAQRTAAAFPDLTTTDAQGATIAGPQTLRLAPIDALELGGARITGLTANAADDARPAGAGPDYAGRIGAPALRGMILTLDYPGAWFSLTPTPGP